MSLCRCASTMRWPGWRSPKNKKPGSHPRLRVTAWFLFVIRTLGNAVQTVFPVITPSPFPAFPVPLAWFYQRHGHRYACKTYRAEKEAFQPVFLASLSTCPRVDSYWNPCRGKWYHTGDISLSATCKGGIARVIPPLTRWHRRQPWRLLCKICHASRSLGSSRFKFK